MARFAKKLRVFVDANILFAGSIYPRWPYEVLRHGLLGNIQLITSSLAMDQCHRNLQQKFPFALKRFEEFLAEANHKLAPEPSDDEIEAHKTLVRDITDVPIALSAIKAKADYLVSEDKDLTDKNDSTAELHRQIKVRISGTFLREVMGWTSGQLEAIRHRKWSDMPEDTLRNLKHSAT